MKVITLINKLKKLDQDKEILVWSLPIYKYCGMGTVDSYDEIYIKEESYYNFEGSKISESTLKDEDNRKRKENKCYVIC